MILRDLVSNLPRVTVAGSLDAEIHAITASSRDVVPGMIFAAIRGTTLDGHRFVNDALAAGATAILAETAQPSDYTAPATWLHVPDSREAVSTLASTLAGHPWKDLKMAGVTGTNGKTTTAFLLHHLMKSGEMLGSMLLTWVNIAYYQHLTAGMRDAIARGGFDDFVAETQAMWMAGDLSPA